ncbi:hypothetical protein EVAR_82765_1 [Eumeta japonica]|uniref:Uncharacterized protein n=1 Tax=Eumeta variegata TaxID=151549 RepID=A0A4C1UNU9_EUMVA|nr:hypothetical protein EVAR_82765_1 [Eumeta japonica]
MRTLPGTDAGHPLAAPTRPIPQLGVQRLLSPFRNRIWDMSRGKYFIGCRFNERRGLSPPIRLTGSMSYVHRVLLCFYDIVVQDPDDSEFVYGSNDLKYYALRTGPQLNTDREPHQANVESQDSSSSMPAPGSSLPTM